MADRPAGLGKAATEETPAGELVTSRRSTPLGFSGTKSTEWVLKSGTAIRSLTAS